MKKYLSIFALVLLGACTDNNTENSDEQRDSTLLSTDIVTNPHTANGIDSNALSKLPTMDFEDTVHDFGNMAEGEVAQYDFEFKNNGNAPLIVSAASGSCGCTVPEYPREPIPPGQTGVMQVKFNSEGKPGHQEKSVTIQTNSKRGVHMLYIKADVTPNNN